MLHQCKGVYSLEKFSHPRFAELYLRPRPMSVCCVIRITWQTIANAASSPLDESVDPRSTLLFSLSTFLLLAGQIMRFNGVPSIAASNDILLCSPPPSELGMCYLVFSLILTITSVVCGQTQRLWPSWIHFGSFRL